MNTKNTKNTKNVIESLTYEKAQEYESAYWIDRQTDPVGIIHDLEGTFALSQHIQREGYLKKQFRRFLDLGCGGLGIGLLWLINSDESYGIDPLPVLKPKTNCVPMDEFIRTSQAKTVYVQSGAENLPFENEFFDFIICNNVLDHVHDPYSILNEVKRTLEPGGLFAFSVDTHSLRTFLVKKINKLIRPNFGELPGHPYEWLEDDMTNILINHGFTIESHIRRSRKGRYLGRRRQSTYLLRHGSKQP